MLLGLAAVLRSCSWCFFLLRVAVCSRSSRECQLLRIGSVQCPHEVIQVGEEFRGKVLPIILRSP